MVVSSPSLSKELKEGDELLQFLRTMLADTVVTEAKSLSVQLEDLMRLLSLFDAKGMRKLLKTMHDERCRRSAYAAYLQQSKLTLLQQRSLLQRMLGRVQREQRLAVRSVLELCVHLFLEQRCDSQLKAFVQQFQQLQTQDEKTDVLERFLRAVYCSAETEPMLQGCTSKQISYVQGCIERLVLTRIYFSALYPNGDGDIMRDKLFHETVERLSATITPGHKNIAIPSIYHAESPWPSAQAELAIINVQKAGESVLTPREKVNCVRRCCETVLQLLSISGSNVPSADDIMPVLVFVVIKTNPEALLSTIQYVNGFYGNRLRGEDAYWWAQFCSAVEFIKILADMDTRKNYEVNNKDLSSPLWALSFHDRLPICYYKWDVHLRMADDGEEPGIPRASLNKVIRDTLPHARLSGDFRDMLHECCLQFVKYVGTEANRICVDEQKKTINKEHLFQAVANMGFGSDYIDAGRSVLDKCNEEASRRLKRQSTRLEKCGIPEDELLRTQQELFAKARLEQATAEQLQVTWFQQRLQEHARLQQQQQQAEGASNACSTANFSDGAQIHSLINLRHVSSKAAADSDEDYDAE
ncbi:vacuolar sorting protein 9 domain protein [Trichuris suis]|nr:vacuolar sorting protein 9 domain protein [Trichuris suis]